MRVSKLQQKIDFLMHLGHITPDEYRALCKMIDLWKDERGLELIL